MPSLAFVAWRAVVSIIVVSHEFVCYHWIIFAKRLIKFSRRNA